MLPGAWIYLHRDAPNRSLSHSVLSKHDAGLQDMHLQTFRPHFEGKQEAFI